MRCTRLIQNSKTGKWAVINSDSKGNNPAIVANSESDNSDEALEKYRQDLLDRYSMYTVDDEQHKCRVCDEWTSTYAVIPEHRHRWWLCSAHANTEEVDRLFVLSHDFQLWTS